MNRVTDPAAFVRWFRNSSPYINAHRGRTFVVCFGGEALLDPSFSELIHDITLLNSLGVRLVLVYGVRPQVRAKLQQLERAPQHQDGLRVVDETELRLWTESAGSARIGIESRLTLGLTNSPMAGSNMRVISGNLVVARPVGVRKGVDCHFAGEVRKIDVQAIRTALDAGALVLLGPLGYSPTGEVFALRAEEVALATATALRTDKLIYLAEAAGPLDEQANAIRQLSEAEAEALLAQRKDLCPVTARHLGYALQACSAGVRRTHLLHRAVDGALLQELFTRDGVGTLVAADAYEGLRPADIDDLGGILELIAPLEREGVLVRRSRELLEGELDRFVVLERDGGILACAALYPFVDESFGELACVATHPDYRKEGRAEACLAHLEERAQAANIRSLFVLTTHAHHWFQERGFEPAEVTDLPLARQTLYNYQRSSRVFIKRL